MSARWLQERWTWFLPQVAGKGREQEEEIRRLCETEMAAWRSRPTVTSLRSLRTPLTQTRHRLRQVPLTADNSWVNPKTQRREHLALKYLTYASEEWVQMAIPNEQSMQRREALQLWLAEPDVLVEMGQRLLQEESWPEVVLGIVLNTGRSFSEVVRTSTFSLKTTYSLAVDRRSIRRDRPSLTLEVPTFARAQEVLRAVSRVRSQLDWAAMETRALSRGYGPRLREAAYQQFLGLVPLRPGEYDLYQALRLGVYPCLAVYYYCPESIDALTYMATIQGHERVLAATSEQERHQLRRAGHYGDYRVRGEGKGMRLADPEVEPLLACAWMRRCE